MEERGYAPTIYSVDDINLTKEEMEAFRKAWEAAIPKLTEFKTTFIYGTGGD